MIVSIRATRVSPRPVIPPGSVPGYASIFNPGLLHHDGVFHLFARGVRRGHRRNPGPGPRFLDYVSDVLCFRSPEGLDYEFCGVLAEASTDGARAYEDPRVQRVRSDGVEHVVMTYTDLSDTGAQQPWRIGLHRLAAVDGIFELNRTSGHVIGPPGVPNKNAVIFNLADGRVAMLHRVHPDIQLAVFGSLEELVSPPDGYWEDYLAHLDRHVIVRPSPGSFAVGAGAPPVETVTGLLLFYHERDGDGVYSLRVALVDPVTGRVVAKLSQPLLEPELSWEVEGDVPNVVFVQGAHRLPDGTIYLTYGAADRAVGAATVDETALLAALS